MPRLAERAEKIAGQKNDTEQQDAFVNPAGQAPAHRGRRQRGHGLFFGMGIGGANSRRGGGGRQSDQFDAFPEGWGSNVFMLT